MLNHRNRSLLIFFTISSVFASEIPVPCESIQSTVARLDCIQEQHEILNQILEYEQTQIELERIRQEQRKLNKPNPVVIPAVAEVSSDDDEKEISDELQEQIAWFDQSLEVYGIVGSANDMTAYARMDGREFRLQEGDVIRLAKVVKVHLRGVRLSIFGHDLEIGLSGRSSKYDDGQ